MFNLWRRKQGEHNKCSRLEPTIGVRSSSTGTASDHWIKWKLTCNSPGVPFARHDVYFIPRIFKCVGRLDGKSRLGTYSPPSSSRHNEASTSLSPHSKSSEIQPSPSTCRGHRTPNIYERSSRYAHFSLAHATRPGIPIPRKPPPTPN